MLQSIAVFAVVAVAAALSSPVADQEPLFPNGVDGWNELLGGKSFFEESLNAIQTKSSEDAVKLQQFEDLLSQDDVMTSAYLKYRTMFEKNDATRIYLLKESMLEVARHNLEAAAGKHSWSMEVNHFADMTSEEWEEMLGGSISMDSSAPATPYKSTSGVAAPASLNYVDQGIVSKVKGQGSCGTCVMFASAAILESADATTNNHAPYDLSTQELTDCAIPGFTCPKGGSPFEKSLDYMKNNGITTWDQYPYVAYNASVGECRKDAFPRNAGVLSYKKSHLSSDADQEQNLADNGPLGVFIHASKGLKNYAKGVFDGADCGDLKVNHGVALVGYGQEGGEKYWLIKNSWETKWAQEGYGKIKYSVCRITDWAYSVKAVKA